MRRRASRIFRLLAVVFVVGLCPVVATPAAATNSFVVAAYNVENWNRIERHGQADQPKPLAERQGVIDILARLRPDILGLEEMGSTNDLAELAAGLAQHGLEYPQREWIAGADPDRHVALLSRFPITGRYSRTADSYQVGTNTLVLTRGILDVAIRVDPQCSLRAMVVHLKSRLAVKWADQEAMRGAEARLLRQHLEAVLRTEPALDLLVMGDLNDSPDSVAARTVIGADPWRLIDLRPVDSHGGGGTHFWAVHQEFSRIDYLLCSPSLATKYVADSARIADFPGWFAASDHRAISARFTTGAATVAGPSRAMPATRGATIYLAIGLVLLGDLIAIGVFLRREARRRGR